MKNKMLTIRVSEQFSDTLNRLCKKYNISQSRLFEILLYEFNDHELVNMDIKIEKLKKSVHRG